MALIKKLRKAVALIYSMVIIICISIYAYVHASSLYVFVFALCNKMVLNTRGYDY